MLKYNKTSRRSQRGRTSRRIRGRGCNSRRRRGGGYPTGYSTPRGLQPQHPPVQIPSNF